MSPSSVRDAVVAFRGKRILVVGDVMVDEYVWGEVGRVSPEAPVPVVEVRSRTFAPGGAGNAAANVVSLGGDAWLGGAVGRDHSARELRTVLGRAGVHTEGLLEDAQRPTTTKTRVVAQQHQVLRIDAERRAPLPPSLEDALLAWARGRLASTDACVLSDYGKGIVSRRVAEDLIRMARGEGKPVVVDPKGTDYTKYRGATVVTPNVREAERAVNREIDGEGDLADVARQLLAVLEGSALLVTRGAEGMSLFRDGARPVHISAAARSVFDVTGAGDTVVATLGLALATGLALEDAARLATRAAGVVVERFGTVIVTLDELIRHTAVARDP